MTDTALRVLHIDLGREMRGGQRQALLLAEELKGQLDQTLMAPAGSPLLAAARASGLHTVEAGWTALRRHSAACSLIHAHDAASHTRALLAGRGRPLVVSRRVAFPVRSSPLSRWKYSRPDCYLAVSETVRGQLIRAGVADKKIRVVPDAVRVPDAPADIATQKDWTKIVALASQDPGKCNPLIREAARLAGVEVRFSSDLARDLPSAGIFIYLSESEGLGSAALLAMAHGAAVVASAAGGLEEAVENGVTGLLTPNRAPDASAAIRRLLDDPALAARMGDCGRRRAQSRFHPAAMAAATLAAYRQVLA